MREYKSVDVTESQLEDLIRQYADKIEEGLRFIEHQRHTEHGRLDVLLVDSGNALVVAELKIVEDDNMLMQGIDYYDDIFRNLGSYAHIFGDKYGINIAEEPRLFLIAPSFSVSLLNRIKWVDIPISLFNFTCIELSDSKGDKVPIFTEIVPPSVQRMPVKYTIDDRLNYIIDSKAQNSARQVLEEIKEWDKIYYLRSSQV